MTGPRPIGFEVGNTVIGGQHRPIARFLCVTSGCDTPPLELHMKSGQKLNPELLAGQARVRGWEADAFRRSPTYCPKCKAVRAGRTNDVDSELRKHEAKAKLMNTTTITNQDEPEMPAPAAVPIRSPTPDQRDSIRNLLDKYFGTEEGCYSGEWTDQLVAETVNVPRIVVEQIREVAYGPIRISPAQKALLREIEAVRKECADLAALAATIITDLGKLNARLDELTAKSRKVA